MREKGVREPFVLVLDPLRRAFFTHTKLVPFPCA